MAPRRRTRGAAPQSRTIKTAVGEQEGPPPPTNVPLALQTNYDGQQPNSSPATRQGAARHQDQQSPPTPTRTTVPPATRPRPSPRCHRPGLRRGSRHPTEGEAKEATPPPSGNGSSQPTKEGRLPPQRGTTAARRTSPRTEGLLTDEWSDGYVRK
jgi:hypothetical protein